MIESTLINPILQTATGNMIGQALGSGPVVALVLLILIGLSAYTWAIIVFKVIFFRKAETEDEIFRDQFWQLKNLAEIFGRSRAFKFSPSSELFRAGYRELKKLRKTDEILQPDDEESFPEVGGGIETIKRVLEKERLTQQKRIDRHLNFLATTASAAPFIGLFGTVWGIMDAFAEIGKMGSANLAVVAPGISEALIATATGLAAAIPAVMAYNFLSARARSLGSDMESFTADFLNICDRHFV